MTHVHHCMCVMLPQKSTTLSGALSEVVSSAQVVQELPLANCTMDSRFVYYIVNNTALRLVLPPVGTLLSSVSRAMTPTAPKGVTVTWTA